MTHWVGQNRKTTSVGIPVGESEYQQNTRMLVEGELQLRHGMAAANLPPATGVYGVIGAFTPAAGAIVVQVQPTTMQGGPVRAAWQDAATIPPVIGGGGGSCVVWDEYDEGISSPCDNELIDQELPVNSCQGTLTLTETSPFCDPTIVGFTGTFQCYSLPGGGGTSLAGPFSFGPIVNNAISYTIPAGTRSVILYLTCPDAPSESTLDLDFTCP